MLIGGGGEITLKCCFFNTNVVYLRTKRGVSILVSVIAEPYSDVSSSIK